KCIREHRAPPQGVVSEKACYPSLIYKRSQGCTAPRIRHLGWISRIFPRRNQRSLDRSYSLCWCTSSHRSRYAAVTEDSVLRSLGRPSQPKYEHLSLHNKFSLYQDQP